MNTNLTNNATHPSSVDRLCLYATKYTKIKILHLYAAVANMET
jgi:hypothetical protein